MRGIIKYPGSKWRIADWIISFFPPHHTYLEPFFGSGAVLFSKPRSDIETVNDLDGDVVNLFSWIRDDPETLAKAIYATPYARDVYNTAQEEYDTGKNLESLKKAVNFCIRLNMGFGYRTTGSKVGWKSDVHGREKAYAAIDWSTLPERVIEASKRLRGVQIEHQDALELIQRYNYDDVLLYCDPPYAPGTRQQKQYACEMFDQKEHEKLLQTILAHKGSALVSGYSTELYEDMLRGWHRESTKSRTQLNVEKEEILWMNFEPAGQYSIFDFL